MKAPGVVTGRYGTLGQVFYVTQDFWPLNTTLYVRDFKGSEPKFVSYFLKTIDFHACSDKAAVPGVNRNDLHELLVRVPPVLEQRKIARVLGALDDKVELNRRTNETLEAMARALFKSWFVDFDPVRAKAEGRQPAGMDQDTANLFPSELVDSELGQIPSGWAVARLREMTVKIGSGSTPRGGDAAYVDEGVALIRSQNVYDSEFAWAGLVRLTDDDAERLSNVEVAATDVLFNITGASFLRTCMVDPAVLPARVNQHVAIIRAAAGVPPNYLHQHMLRETTKDYLRGLDAGASRQAVTKGHLESVPVIRPPEPVAAVWAALVDPLMRKRASLAHESTMLATVRDALLPRLLSGEIEGPT